MYNYKNFRSLIVDIVFILFYQINIGAAMEKEQKKITLLLVIIGVIYFIIFIFPNLTGAQDEHMLFVSSQDESFQFSFLKNMLTPGKDIHETRSHWISYGHYIYGYPFYLYSAILILPVRWLYGFQFLNQTQN